MTIGEQVRRAQRTGTTVQLENGILVGKLRRPVNQDVETVKVTIPNLLLRNSGLRPADPLEELVMEWVARGMHDRSSDCGNVLGEDFLTPVV